MARSCIPTFSILVALIALPVLSSAQESRIPTQQTPVPASPSLSTLLDAPVDRTRYVLGPGDGVDLSVLGEVNRFHNLVVTPEGAVVIPTIGVVSVLGLTLDEAQARVREQVLQYYRNVDVYLTLSQVRTFKVFVVGDVSSPGVRIATAATRASEVVPLKGNSGAEGESGSADSLFHRDVLLRRASGSETRLDFARFRRLGDMSENPLLREGDALIVPAIDKTVSLHGRFFFPGTYEHRRGESLAELLALANGIQGFPSDAADTLRVARLTDSGERRHYLISKEDALGARGREFLIEPFDAVYLAHTADYAKQERAVVQGLVVHPGTYPVQSNATTVRDLVTLAGGLAPNASLAGATLRRKPGGVENELLQQLRALPPDLLSDDERRLLVASKQGDETNVVIDFRKLLIEGKNVHDQVLQSGDVLRIPERRPEVTILGAVAHPGIVQHTPGQGVDYFIHLAGGYNRKADQGDVVVIKAGSASRVGADEVKSLDPGDTVVVPFEERVDWLRALQTTSSVVTTVTGLVLTFLAFVQ